MPLPRHMQQYCQPPTETYNLGTQLSVTTNKPPDSLKANNMPSDSEPADKGHTRPSSEGSEPPTPPASNTLRPQSKIPISLMPMSKMPASTAQSSSTSKTPPQASHEPERTSGSEANIAEPRRVSFSTDDQTNSLNASGRPLLPRCASPAPAEPTKQLTPPSSIQIRRPPTPVDSPAREATRPPTEPTSDSISSQSLDTHDRNIIAASATLAYFQDLCGEEKSPDECQDNSCATKVKELTKLAKGMLRFPGEKIAITADIFQTRIRLMVAHDSGNAIQSHFGEKEREQPEE